MEYHIDVADQHELSQLLEPGIKNPRQAVRLWLVSGTLAEFRVNRTEGDTVFGQTAGFPNRSITVRRQTLTLSID